MNRLAFPLILVGLIAPPVQAQPRDPSEVVTRQVSTAEGKLLLVRTYATWRSDCTARGEPVVTVTTQPHHGTTFVRPGMSTIREYSGGSGDCVGRQVPGVSVWYQPTPGYRGPDQFSLTINMTHVLHDIIVVAVQ